MESKIIEYGIILLHKYKIEQTEVISILLFIFFYSQMTGTFVRIEHLHFSNTFLKVCKAPNQSVIKNVDMFF